MIFSSIILHGLPLGLLIHFSDRSLRSTLSRKGTEAKPLNYFDIFKRFSMILVICILLIIDVGMIVEYYFTVDLSVMRGFSQKPGATLLSLLGFASLFGRITGTVLLALHIQLNGLWCRVLSCYLHLRICRNVSGSLAAGIFHRAHHFGLSRILN